MLHSQSTMNDNHKVNQCQQANECRNKVEKSNNHSSVLFYIFFIFSIIQKMKIFIKINPCTQKTLFR